MYSYLNGNFIKNSDASIAPTDRGLLLGDGLFETLRSDQGNIGALAMHWRRLQKGLHHLKIPMPLDFSQINDAIKQLLTLNQLLETTASIRMTVTRGPSVRGLSLPPIIKPTILITAAPYLAQPSPVRTIISNYTINEKSPLTKFKTLNYLERILAKEEARKSGFDDAILLNTEGAIVGTTAANIFMIKDRTLFTPHLDSGTLPGITREIILSIANQHNLNFHETNIFPDNISSMKEIFITNSLIKITPVFEVEEHYHKNEIGPLTQQLMDQYQAFQYKHQR